MLVDHYLLHHAQRQAPLSPFASLLATLHWMRRYPSTRSLAAELKCSQMCIIEALNHRIDALFITFVPACISNSSLPPRVYKSGPAAGARLVVDSTYLTLPHHSDKKEGKSFYHLKSPTHQALKWQLTVTTDGEPWHISDVVNGSMSDITLPRESGLLALVTGDTKVIGDKGYIGEEKVTAPRKKPRLAELSAEAKEENKQINSKRVVVENCFHEFKKWAILGEWYRGDHRSDDGMERATRIVHVIAALVKRQLAAHPLRAHPEAAA